MDILFKAVFGVLISVILCHTIPKERRELAMVLSIAVCCMVGIAAFSCLNPIKDFLERLQCIGDLNREMMEILMKSVGISFVTEITRLVCNDFNNGALGKVVQFLAVSVILWMALPIFEELIHLLESILLLE